MTDKLEKEISEEVGAFSSKRAPSNVTVTFDDDLFGPSPPTKSSKKKENKGADLFGDDDVFSQPPKPAPKSTAPKTTSVEDDSFSSAPTSSKKPKSEVNLFDKPPEDIFASGSSKTKDESNDLFAPSKGETKKLDDIFADSAPKKRGPQKTKKEVEKKTSPEEVDGVSHSV